MIRRILIAVAVLCVAGAAAAQENCTLYKVNTSLLNISKDAGGAIYTDALFDGDTACVTRRAIVGGADWAFIAHKVEGANRTPVEGWAALQYLQPAAGAGAASAPASPPVSFSPPPAVAVAPGAPAAAPASPNASAAMRPDEILRFDQPIPFGPYPLNGKSLKELTDTVPMFAPIEGLDESLWKKNCRECHQWSQQNLCQQAATYLQTPRYALRVSHPFGGTLQIAMMRWAKSGCQ